MLPLLGIDPLKSLSEQSLTIRSNECKKKKLKCIREDHDEACRRCIASDNLCIFTVNQQQNGVKETPRPRHVSVERYETARPEESGWRDEVAQLREQVASLTASLREINNRTAHMTGRSPALNSQQNPSPVYTTEAAYRPPEPRQPQFIGPTRSTFSLRIAETSLTRMGIQTGDTPGSRSASPVGLQDPSPAEIQNLPADMQHETDCLLSFELDELLRLLDVYEEEIESVYPFTNIKEFSVKLPLIIEYVRNIGTPRADDPSREAQIELKDVQIVKLAIATAIIIEARGSNTLSKKLVDSVESVVCRVSGEAKIDLKEVQIMTMLVSLDVMCPRSMLT